MGKTLRTLCVVGIQWGDEGKGKIVDILAKEHDYVVRFQGGANAGHTVVIGKEKFVLHHIPSGIFNPGTTCVIGNGVVVDPDRLLEEVEGLRPRGVKIGKNLAVSERSHLVMPYHKLQDVLSEAQSKVKIGTTQRGVGPCYADKVGRKGLRVVDLYNPRALKDRIGDLVSEKKKVLKALYGKAPIQEKALLQKCRTWARRLKPFVTDTLDLVNSVIDRGKRVLFEGAQGSMLDIDFGTYPYVTSSNSDVCGVSSGTGVPPRKIRNILGIAKAYTTRVGLGPFPTELHNSVGDQIRKAGNEFGSTTGRPRRCGWFDGVAARFAVRFNGVDQLAITKLDVLSGMPEIRVCLGYRLNGSTQDRMPVDADSLEKVRPVYKSFAGWKEDLSGIRKFNDLPRAARTYLNFLQRYLNVKISMISVGTERGKIIRR